MHTDSNANTHTAVHHTDTQTRISSKINTKTTMKMKTQKQTHVHRHYQTLRQTAQQAKGNTLDQFVVHIRTDLRSCSGRLLHLSTELWFPDFHFSATIIIPKFSCLFQSFCHGLQFQLWPSPAEKNMSFCHPSMTTPLCPNASLCSSRAPTWLRVTTQQLRRRSSRQPRV